MNLFKTYMVYYYLHSPSKGEKVANSSKSKIKVLIPIMGVGVCITEFIKDQGT